MPHLVRSAVALALASALVPVIPAEAFHDPPIPLLDTVTLAGSGYAAWRVLAPEGARLDLESQGRPVEGARQVAEGMWFLRPGSLSVRAALLGASWTYGGVTQLHVQLPEPVGVVLSQSGGGFTAGGTAVGVPTDAAGEWMLVAFTAVDGDWAGALRLYGGGGAAVLARTTGPAFLHREPDFRGQANALATLPQGPDRQVEAKAMVGASVSDVVAGRLFGAFAGSYALGDLAMGYDGPDGAHDGATFYPFHGAPAGDYRFRVDHNYDAWDNFLLCAECESPHVWAAGADVALP